MGLIVGLDDNGSANGDLFWDDGVGQGNGKDLLMPNHKTHMSCSTTAWYMYIILFNTCRFLASNLIIKGQFPAED